jgi:hypothetical protein
MAALRRDFRARQRRVGGRVWRAVTSLAAKDLDAGRQPAKCFCRQGAPPSTALKRQPTTSSSADSALLGNSSKGVGRMKKQRPETCLFRVAGGGQGVGQFSPGHDRERDAIGERLRLIGAGGEQLRNRIQPLGSGRDDFRSRVGVQPSEKRDEECPVGPANQAVSELKYDILGGDERPARERPENTKYRRRPAS